MKPYGSSRGDSGVVAYEYGRDWIRLRFADGRSYEYAIASVGAVHLETMKRLAESGEGLTTYINKRPEVRDGYV